MLGVGDNGLTSPLPSGLKLRCERPGVWPCATCRKRGCADVCPDGTLRPTGRSSKAQVEVLVLAKRLEELEGVLKDAGIGHRIPPPLDPEFLLGRGPANDDEVDSRRPQMHERGAVVGIPPPVASGNALDGIMDGVGSLSIREEDGRTRFLGTSAGSAYFAAVSRDRVLPRKNAELMGVGYRGTRIRPRMTLKTTSRLCLMA